MSKFDELCQALGAVRGEFYEYRRECFLIVGAFMEGLSEYLGAPVGQISLYAKGGSFAGRKVDGPAAAMHLADDTFWHFGVALDLNDEQGGLSYHTVGFDLRLKKVGNDFIIHVDDGPAHVVHSGRLADLEVIYEAMFVFLRDRYRNSFQEFLGGDAGRRFGF